MYIETKQAMALRKHGAPLLRSLAVKDPSDFAPHTLEWSEINKRQALMLTTARSFLDRIQTDTPEATTIELEAAQEAIMELWEAADREKDMRSQLGTRAPRSTGDHPRRPGYGEDVDDRGGRDEGGGDDSRAVALKPEQRMADHVALKRGRADVSGLSAGAYLRSLVLGAKTDLEKRALSEGNDSAGGYTVPELISLSMIDRMRANMVVMKAGARTVPLTSDTTHFARVLTDPVPAWRAEAGAVAESGPTFDRVTFSPKSIAVLVKVSRELLEDSVNIEDALMNVLTSAMALEVDRVAMFGTGDAPEPRGIVNTANVNAVALNGQLVGYAPLISARTAILGANSPGVTAYVMNPREEGSLAGRLDGQGQPLRVPPKIEAIPFLQTSAVPKNGGVGANESSIIGGYFPHLLIGMRSELRIEILRERYADNMQYGFLAHLRADVQLEHPESFTKITGIAP
jgi:HK97 family phage major capsid protein